MFRSYSHRLNRLDLEKVNVLAIKINICGSKIQTKSKTQILKYPFSCFLSQSQLYMFCPDSLTLHRPAPSCTKGIEVVVSTLPFFFLLFFLVFLGSRMCCPQAMATGKNIQGRLFTIYSHLPIQDLLSFLKYTFPACL